ncbi:mannosylglycerate hydrolase [Niallia circulans]|uniref:Mannosylglycerate hydrolase n=1 Tax=Niallia circulans TaxID=1397 RepID=A0A553SNA8_NIACI|nr:mannosylglycerate hydrolase [Niallia circulans]TRZ38475.1 mannosylglycerate hydrolase [Niallia circulans]
MKKVHIIPHMHWDREWYFSTEESRILLVNNMEEIFEVLEGNPDYPCFLLDGQTAILEDYLAVKPQAKDRIKKLVQTGKLLIGPWYTQTDEMIVGGESIVRNLLYGSKDCEAFGEAMKIGYLPDSFGQSAQLPQILNGFDIKHFIFWRGASERLGTDKTEFYWESDEGSRVLVQLLPLGYAIGKYLPEEEEALQTRMKKYFPVLDKGSTNGNVILPNGHDQMPIQQNIFEVMETLKRLYPDREFLLSSYMDSFAALSSSLPTVRGEMLDGKYMRVHRSIFSSRMDIKAANTRIENKIVDILEPLAAIAYSLGFEYHHGLIELIWKEVLKNHAHDSIGCCCSDKVHQEIMNRFVLAEEKIDRLIDFYKRKISDAIATDRKEDIVTAFNLLSYERVDTINAVVTTKQTAFILEDANGSEIPFELVEKVRLDPGLVDRQLVHYENYEPFWQYHIQFKAAIPAMGYKAFFIVPQENEMEAAITEKDWIETDYYHIKVNANGTLTIFDKEIGLKLENVLLLETSGDDGDEYDFSPVLNEEPNIHKNASASFVIMENSYEAQIYIKVKLPLPKDLQDREDNRNSVISEIKWNITIPFDKPIINVAGAIHNNAKDYRLRTYIPSKIAAAVSVSDNQFGSIKRSVLDPAIQYWEEEGWDERPDAIYPMLSYVSLCNDYYTVSTLTNSIREYEIVGAESDTIALTLLRSVGYLGKENLVRRPGRPSGIKLSTPDSQMIGQLNVEFAVSTKKGAQNTGKLAKEYRSRIQTYNKIPYNAMKLNTAVKQTPLSFSLLQDTNSANVLSTLKKAEKEEGLILRLYNPTEKEVESSFILKTKYKDIFLCQLNENIICPLAMDTNTISICIKPNQVQTILIK